MIKDIIENNENKSINQDRINQLKQIIPNCFDKNGNLDIELLKKEFDSELNFTRESFELNFLGKSYAKMITGLDTETVIEPDTEHNSIEENKNSENIYISGDNLDALKHLLKAYEGKIKCIYIDPPYNTGSDGFVYNDTFKFTKESLIEKLDIGEDEAERIISMTSGNSSSHSAWLTFMYPRLYLAKNLLKENGVIFISIDDNEQPNLKLLCDEIFGEENKLANLVWKKKYTGGKGTNTFADYHEYILVYAKNVEKLGDISMARPENEKDKFIYEDEYVKERGKYYTRPLKSNLDPRPTLVYPIQLPDGTSVTTQWICAEDTFLQLKSEGRIVFKDSSSSKYPVYKKFYELDGGGNIKIPSFLEVSNNNEAKEELKNLFNIEQTRDLPFQTPKPTKLLELLIENFTSDGDIVLDFFSGSASTAHAVLNLNAKRRKIKYILVQLQEECDDRGKKLNFNTIDEIGQERIKRAAKKIKEKTNANIDYGFKHYTLKETSDKVLNKLEQFNADIINENYDLYEEYGIDTILETWKLKDGYEFTTNIKTIDCNGYNVYKCEECLYFIEPNITIKNIEALLEQYSKDEKFTSNKLVLFGYSFKFNELEMIKNNIKQVKNFKNIDVKVYTRY